MLYNGPLLCGFNVPIKGLTVGKSKSNCTHRFRVFTVYNTRFCIASVHNTLFPFLVNSTTRNVLLVDVNETTKRRSKSV